MIVCCRSSFIKLLLRSGLMLQLIQAGLFLISSPAKIKVKAMNKQPEKSFDSS